MNIVPAVLTWDVHRTGRFEFLQRTLASIRAEGIEPLLITNGSSDGTDKFVLAQPRGIVENSNPKMFWGATVAILAAIDAGADVVVLSADDIEYKPGWLSKLRAFWEAAPDNLVLAGGFLEPVYPWAEIKGAVEYGGVRALVRDSVPSASWTFRARDWDIIKHRPTGTVYPQSPGEDLETCKMLRALGKTLVQLDLAEHIGERQSSWSNESWKIAQPLDRKAWGFE